MSYSINGSKASSVVDSGSKEFSDFLQAQNNIILWLLVIILFPSCAQTPSPHALFTDVMEISFNQVPNGERVEVADVAVDSEGEIFICDRKNSWVFCFAPDGSYLRHIGRRDERSGDIIFPHSLAIDKEDNLYIGCWKEVLVFNSEGERIQQFSTSFRWPESIAVDSTGYVYLVGVENAKNGVIHKYNPEGKWLKSFGNVFEHKNFHIRRQYSGGQLTLARDRLYMTYRTPYDITVYSIEGFPTTQFQRPELDFQPNFKIKGNTRYFGDSARGLTVCIVSDMILNTFVIPGKGIYLDVFNDKKELLLNPIHKDIPLGVHILATDQEGNIYYGTKRRGASIFRGRMISQLSVVC